MRQLLKKLAYQTFKSVGLDIPRPGMRTTLAGVLDHLLKLDFKPQTVIDVGVAYGTFELYEKFPEASHLLVEPLSEFEGVLQDICRKYRAQYVVAAAGDKPGKLVINVHPELEGTSLFKESEGSRADGVPRDIPVVTLDDVCGEKNFQGPYMIKVDVQGAELQVLEGAKQILKETEVILLEVSLFQFMVNGPQLYEVVSYMKERGFVVYDIFGGHNRPLDGALAQIDMAFVKENGQFRKEHFYATPEQRQQLTKKGRLL
jgi:FkbM family methyltransferase